MIILVCDWFNIYRDGIPTGEKEYVASHGIDVDTGRHVIVQCIPPQRLGAKYDSKIGEWILYGE